MAVEERHAGTEVANQSARHHDALNWQLSCNRAASIESELMHPSASRSPGLPAGSINVFMQGETAEFGAEEQNRRATIFPPLAGSSEGTPTNQPSDGGDIGQPTPTPQNTTPSPTGGGDGDGMPQQPDTRQAAPPERPACAVNPSCPDDYCQPFPTRQAALDDRTFNAESILSTISSANAHAEPLSASTSLAQDLPEISVRNTPQTLPLP
jgi:hypothetical protein